MAVSIKNRSSIDRDTGDAGGCSALVYSGAKPWGDRGVEVPAGTSVRDAMALDPVQFSDLDLRPMMTIGGNFEPIDVPAAQAVVRRADDAVLSVVGADYRIHQPSELADFFGRVAGAAQTSVDTLGTLRGGRVMWAQADVHGLRLDVGTLQAPDVSQSRLTILTSHDGTLATQIGSCATRIVCRNTFTHALGEKQEGRTWYKIRHTSQSESQLRDVESAIRALVDGWQAYAAGAQALVDKRLTAADVADVLSVLVPDPAAVDGRTPSNAKAQAKRDAILWELSSGAGADLSSARGTAWGLFNAVTAWSTWGQPVKGGESARWDSALLGNGADVATQAWNLLQSF